MENLKLSYKERAELRILTAADEPSATIPGQSLLPAELLKRHLAGTLPDIDLSQQYEYHYDEDGVQIAEPLPLEMHELHTLAVALRKRQFEEATEHRRQEAIKFREGIIEDYKKSLTTQTTQTTENPDPESTE